MAVKRMDNVGIVVEDLDAAIAFFNELGLQLEGRAPIEGDWADGVTGLPGARLMGTAGSSCPAFLFLRWLQITAPHR
jgi:catechol 2,3-dioxygenase-like lactoylglutathione lyase family enzyme